MTKADIARDIGRRLAEFREGLRISQTKLADEIGVSRGAVGQWETGITAPSTENLVEAATKMGASLEWLATGRGHKLPTSESQPHRRQVRQIPILSWVSAGRLADAGSQIPADDVPTMSFADLGRGEFFALKVRGDSMDLVSPDGSIILVNRAERELVHGRYYVFALRAEATYKRWRAVAPDPPYLEPFSSNRSHKPIFVTRKKDLEVVGRVRRTILDL